MVLISGTLSVDTFLIVSGFLLSHGIMKSLPKERMIDVPRALLHRYLR